MQVVSSDEGDNLTAHRARLARRSTPESSARRGAQRFAALAMAGALCLSLAACGDDDDAGNGTSAAPTTAEAGSDGREPKSGGTFTYLQNQELTGWDVAQQTSVIPTSGSQQAAAVFDVLLYVDGETGEVKGRTAESLTSSDSTVWTLKLRPGIRFTDGTPYDAEAVKFSWERIADPANRSSNQSLAASIASAEAVDPLTLRITLKAPNGQFDRLVATRIPYVGSPTALRQDPQGFMTKPVGAGPFMLQDWVRDSHARLVRNPNYWDAPRPYLDELLIRILPDPIQRYNSLQAGQAQGMTDFGSFELYRNAQRDGYPTVPVTTPVGGNAIIFNLTKPPFDDIRARRAVILGLNHEQANEVINGGAPETAAPRFMIREQSPLHDPSVELPRHDAKRAQELLNELAAEKGGPLQFRLSATPAHQTMEFFQSQLSQFDNIRVTLVPVDGAEYLGVLAAGNFEAMVFPAAGFDPEPDWYDWYHTGATRNYKKYSNPAMDAALEKGRMSLDGEERKAAYREVQRIAIADALEAWWSPTGGGINGGYIISKDVRGFTATAGAARWDLVWLDR